MSRFLPRSAAVAPFLRVVLVATLGGCGGGSSGDPDPGCICPAIFAPVCAEDGTTYENQCAADCAGAEVIADGPCEGLPAAPS